MTKPHHKVTVVLKKKITVIKMNELQGEKLRDLIAVIVKETGINPHVQSFTDSTINKDIEIVFRVIIPKEGNLTSDSV
jgi:hypothetical protein